MKEGQCKDVQGNDFKLQEATCGRIQSTSLGTTEQVQVPYRYLYSGWQVQFRNVQRCCTTVLDLN